MTIANLLTPATISSAVPGEREPAHCGRSDTAGAALPHSRKLPVVLLRSKHPTKMVVMRDGAAVCRCRATKRTIAPGNAGRAESRLSVVRRGSRSELEEADIHPLRSDQPALWPATGGEPPDGSAASQPPKS